MGKVDKKVEKACHGNQKLQKIETNEPEDTRKEEHSTRGLNNASIQREEKTLGEKNSQFERMGNLNAWRNSNASRAVK